MDIFTDIYNWGASVVRSFYNDGTGGLTGCTPELPSRPEREDGGPVPAPSVSVSAPVPAEPALTCSQESIMQCINGEPTEGQPATDAQLAAELNLRNQIIEQICIEGPSYWIGNSPDSVVLIRSGDRTAEASARQGTSDVDVRIYGHAVNFFTEAGALPEGVTIELELAEGVSGNNGISDVAVSLQTVTVNGIVQKVLQIRFSIAADAAVGRRNIVIKINGEEVGRGENVFEVTQSRTGGARRGGSSSGGSTPPAPNPPSGNPFEL